MQWDTLPLNVLSTFGLSGDVAFLEPSIPLSHLWPSVRPLPGSVAGWHAIEPSHRLDAFSPYSTIGELGNYGLPILAVYFSVAGALLALLDSRARELIAGGQQLHGLALTALGLLFPVLSLQYQLRTDTRVLYFGLVLLGVSALLRAVRGGGAKRSAGVAALSQPRRGGDSVLGSSPDRTLGPSRSNKPVL